MGWTATAARLTVTVPKGTPAGSYAIGVMGTNQGRSAQANLPVTVVEDLPTAHVPYSAIQVGATMGQTAANVRVLWASATDPSSPITGYELERSQDGGPWGDTMQRTAAQNEAVITLPYGRAFQFRVRAVDRAGNWSPWVATPGATRLYPVDDRNSAIARRGTWVRITSAGAYKSTESVSSVARSRLTLAFTGRSVAVVASTGPHRGRANIYIDGVFISTINTKSATIRARQVVFVRYLAAGGNHTITFEATGSGTYPVVALDAFLVLK
jgi:predicted phage tail protein